jgi:ribosome-associated protein
VSAAERRGRHEAALADEGGRAAEGGPGTARAADAAEGAPSPSADLARRMAGIVDAKKGEGIVALDVRDLVDYTDYLVIATARNERQAKAIYDEVHLRLKKDLGLLPARTEGEREARWLLVDYLDCILHLFVPEMRDRYRLERLWGEAGRLDLGLGGAAPQ